MKRLGLFFVFLLPSLVFGDDFTESFDYQIYTPELVLDDANQGQKGAVKLLWAKGSDKTRYEVEVSNGRSIYSSVGEKNFHHIMIYFGRDYQWRVREVSAKRITDFSDWRPLKVMKSEEENFERQEASVDLRKSNVKEASVDEYYLDEGAQ